MKKILVATDGSDHAIRAVKLAADIAEKYDAELFIVHVMGHGRASDAEKHLAEVEFQEELDKYVNQNREPADTSYGVYSGKPPLWQQYSAIDQVIHQLIGERILKDAAADARENGVRNVETMTKTGDAAEAIVEAAESVGANLIVIGSRGLSTVKAAFLGSVSAKVNQLSDVNVVTVK